MAKVSTKQGDPLLGVALGGILGGAVGGPGGAALGAVLGALAMGQPSERVGFERRLREALAEGGFAFENARLARDESGLLWVVALRTPTGQLKAVHVSISPGSDAYSDDTAANVASRIVNNVR